MSLFLLGLECECEGGSGVGCNLVSSSVQVYVRRIIFFFFSWNALLDYNRWICEWLRALNLSSADSVQQSVSSNPGRNTCVPEQDT